MILEINIDGASVTVPIEEAFRPDLEGISARIEEFAKKNSAEIAHLDFKGLIPGMIRGIVGCERGCPADAKGFISRGYKGFELKYIEGGILTANSMIPDGRQFKIKMFPDF